MPREDGTGAFLTLHLLHIGFLVRASKGRPWDGRRYPRSCRRWRSSASGCVAYFSTRKSAQSSESTPLPGLRPQISIRRVFTPVTSTSMSIGLVSHVTVGER